MQEEIVEKRCLYIAFLFVSLIRNVLNKQFFEIRDLTSLNRSVTYPVIKSFDQTKGKICRQACIQYRTNYFCWGSNRRKIHAKCIMTSRIHCINMIFCYFVETFLKLGNMDRKLWTPLKNMTKPHRLSAQL